MTEPTQESEPPAALQKKTKILALSIALALIVFAGVGGYLWRSNQLYVWTNDAQIEGFYVDISPDILARIITLEVDEGDFVTEGQLISYLDDSIPLSQKIEAEAKVAKTETDVLYQRAHLEKVHNDYIRAKQGIADAIISGQTFDHHEKNFKMAEASLKRAEKAVALAQEELGVILAHLKHTIVLAPRNGYIAKRWVLAGDVMVPGQTMFTLYDLDSVWVLARIDETKIGKVKIGDEVAITVDAYPGYTFTGKVFVIKGAAESQFSLLPQNNATGNYTKVSQRVPVKITIDPPANFPKDTPLYLFPGMSVEVKVYGKR